MQERTSRMELQTSFDASCNEVKVGNADLLSVQFLGASRKCIRHGSDAVPFLQA